MLLLLFSVEGIDSICTKGNAVWGDEYVCFMVVSSLSVDVIISRLPNVVFYNLPLLRTYYYFFIDTDEDVYLL